MAMWMRSRTGGRLAQRTRWLSVEPRTATLHGLELTAPGGAILASICGLGKRRSYPTRSTQLAPGGHQVSTGGEAFGARYLRVRHEYRYGTTRFTVGIETFGFADS